MHSFEGSRAGTRGSETPKWLSLSEQDTRVPFVHFLLRVGFASPCGVGFGDRVNFCLRQQAAAVFCGF